MKNFRYIARNSAGVRKEGLMEASFPNDVLSRLREEGLTPISIKESSAKVKKTAPKARRKRIKSADLAALCWQLNTMTEGGIPITTALQAISEDIENLHLQQILQEILAKIQKGQTLSDSFAEYPRVFNQLSCAMILAGETGGNLPDALQRLAEYFDNRDKLAKKVKGAMAYPIFVFSFIIIIVIFIMAFVVPRFRDIFDQIGGEMPAFTEAFMNVYDVMKTYALHIIGCCALLAISTVLISKTKKGHYLFSRMALTLPLMGKILSQAFVVTFCKTMSTLLAAGVSVLEVFDILSTMSSNDVIKSAVTRTREQIVGGSNLSISMTESGFFPNMVVKMMQVGEESGSLPKVLERTAVYYERKVDSTITTVMGLMEPMMIVIVGGIVLIVVLALYLPIFSMSPSGG
ncbi:MAG TPA: type II secretion system F family protein [Planctomycetes bacterium]|nr:type II secretion system F family protein [Planctomycetota bacterium]